jgi:hypothetical protein
MLGKTVGTRLRQLGERVRAFSSGPAVPTSCPLARTVASGVPVSVTCPAAESRWYEFTATRDGTIDVDWTAGTGGGDISVYIGGSCGSLPTPSLYEAADNNQSGSWPVDAGDVIRVQLEGGPVTGTLELTYTVQVPSTPMFRIPSFANQL